MCLCKGCGASLKDAVPIRTQMLRVCLKCFEENEWPLDEGQVPIGYSVEKDNIKPEEE